MSSCIMILMLFFLYINTDAAFRWAILNHDSVESQDTVNLHNDEDKYNTFSLSSYSSKKGSTKEATCLSA